MVRGIPSLGNTYRLFMRAPQTADLDQLVRLWSDPQATQHIGGPRDRDLVLGCFAEYAADPEAYVQEERERWWIVEHRTDNALVGLCRLADGDEGDSSEGELGYFFLPEHWGRGYATEASRAVLDYAFSGLGMAVVKAVVHPENAASAAVAARLSMRWQGDVPRSDGVVRQIYQVRRDDVERCPGCSAWFAKADGPKHKTFGSSAGCWQTYGEILAMEYGPWGYPSVHGTTVRAYAAQHPGSPSPETIQSVAAHLIGLHLTLNLQATESEAIDALRRVTAAKGGFQWLDPPLDRLRAITVLDVHGAPDVVEHTRRVWDWAQAVWVAWEPHHQTVRRWTEKTVG